MSTFTTELTSQLNIQQNLSTAFHPHTDGQTERMNTWIEQYLRHWVNQQGQDDWVIYLPIAEFTHNSWPHDVSKKTPHKLLFGFNPMVDITPSGVNNSPLATN